MKVQRAGIQQYHCDWLSDRLLRVIRDSVITFVKQIQKCISNATITDNENVAIMNCKHK